MPPTNDSREEFFNEAQEIVDILARDLLILDDALRRDAVDPDTVNDLFRGVHTLKGLSGSFQPRSALAPHARTREQAR